jgi:hypothetical protein
VSFTPSLFYPGTQQIEGWVYPRAGLYAVEERKISPLRQELNPLHPGPNTDLAIPVLPSLNNRQKIDDVTTQNITI